MRDNPQLTVTRLARRPVSIAAANALRIPLSTEPARLVADLREIGRVQAVLADALADLLPERVDPAGDLGGLCATQPATADGVQLVQYTCNGSAAESFRPQ
ncbi:hypothetical protein [Actinoplanes sp. NBRC 103695]|uniref:hypothetical protein n=1 Tax=Actinoplanes sp. NBRC 103695 TaxID=3032202 RepID=UPI0024A2B9C4|nr:hypothetical protein [Actinoplanes sp. NBRC 103695]GLZ00256.1 hypothetical protein Acsp02_75080 [Actinoplanes sp. NBRC 103695]